MSAVLGTFSEVRFVKTRSVIQIIVEVPIENADEAMKALGGFPQPASERWVGVALAPHDREKIEPDATPAGGVVPVKSGVTGRRDDQLPTPKKDRKPFASLPFSQQAAIRCTDKQFQKFLLERGYAFEESESAAAVYIRAICGVGSRRDIIDGELSGGWWKRVEQSFKSYLTDAQYADSIR